MPRVKPTKRDELRRWLDRVRPARIGEREWTMLVQGVNLQDDGRAARALKQRFAENAARQLVQRHARESKAGRAEP